jgi:hypothetical protein
MSKKDDLLAALDDTDYPEGLKNFLLTPLPDIQTIAWPTTEAAAAIATGQLAAIVAQILQPFGGLAPVLLMLHAGQRNRTYQNIMLSMLEYFEDESESQITIIAPVAGAIYYGSYIDPWQVQITGDALPEKVTVTVNGETTELAPGAEGLYEGIIPIPLGEWQATAAAKMKTDTLEALIGFSVRPCEEMPTIPENGGTYAPDTPITLNPGDANVTSVKATIGDQTVTLTKQDDGLWKILGEAFSDFLMDKIGLPVIIAFNIGLNAMEYEKHVNFSVTESVT